jgi:hypothetical protein
MPQTDATHWQLHFPKGGIDRSQAFGRQPNRDVGESVWARTTHRGVNVRAFERQGRRRRGGSRCGLSKYLDARPGGLTYLTQHLAVLVSIGGGSVSAQSSASGRQVRLLNVTEGNVYWAEPGGTTWTAATNGSSTTPPLAATGVLYSTSLLGRQYFTDGSRYRVYDPAADVVSDWSPTAGALPVSGSNVARLLTTWRGRVVLSGVIGDEHNWFMSRVNDALDFDYASADNDSAQAIAGNNSPMGKIGDVVTSLIAYSDDVLVFGGDSTIYAMRGDPLYGGQIDLVTDRVGMAWGVPWARDPRGNLFFFSSTGGVYAFNPAGRGTVPVRISQPIEQLVQGVNTGTHNVVMEWDDTFQELRVFVTFRSAEAVTDHYCWEERTKSWWIDRFEDTAHNPLCSAVVDGNRPEDRCVVVGGWDGYVRKIDADATDDDGEPIESEVLIGPLRSPNLDDIVTDQLQVIMGEDSGEVELEFLAGKTAEAALASAPLRVGTAGAGRSPTFSKRVAGHATYLRVTQTGEPARDGWAIEEARLRVQPKGLARRRVK